MILLYVSLFLREKRVLDGGVMVLLYRDQEGVMEIEVSMENEGLFWS